MTDESPLSVLFLTHAAGAPDVGPNLRVYGIGRHLARAGVRVTIVGSGTFHKYADGRVGPESIRQEQREGMRMVWLRTVDYRHRSVSQVVNQLHFPLRVLLAWRRLNLGRPDVIVASSPPPFIAFVAAWLARRLGAAWVFEARDLWPLVLQGVGSFSGWNPYIRVLKATERFAVSRATRLVVVKPGDREYLAGEYGRTEGVHYIPNGIDPDNLPDPSARRGVEVRRTGERPLRVCYVGALTDYYVLDELIEAFGRVRRRRDGVELTIAGAGPRLERLRALVEERDIPGVAFRGYLDRSGVTRLLSESHIGYVGVRGGPADRHGISTNKLFEYMYMSLPVLACVDTDHDPVEAAGCGVTVREASAEAIAEGLTSLLDRSYDERVAMGANGREYVMKHHYIPKLAEGYEAMLREAAEAAGS